MGLFGWGRRAEAEGPSALYVLAHMAIPSFALERPGDYLLLMADPEARPKLLEMLIAPIRDGMKLRPRLRTEDFTAYPCRVAGFPCLVLEFPEPRRATEAHFTALVGFFDLSGFDPDDEGPWLARYFTLEMRDPAFGAGRTVLGEWVGTGHSNHGDGPPPTLMAFVEALERMVAAGEDAGHSRA
jgi:hypothetical protein